MSSFVKIEGRILEGIFLEKVNRFLVLVKVDEVILLSFLPNPGRMKELLIPGRRVVLAEAKKEDRKTDYDLIGVKLPNQIVSLDSRIPNRIVLQALKDKELKEFSKYDYIRPEYSFGHTRFDFFLRNKDEECFLEVKSCTLVREGIALFPDAVTARGKRHVEDLIKAKKEGYRTSILFIVQRQDASVFSPNYNTDPDFGRALKEGKERGLEVYAYQSYFHKVEFFLEKK